MTLQSACVLSDIDYHLGSRPNRKRNRAQSPAAGATIVLAVQGSYCIGFIAAAVAGELSIARNEEEWP